MFRNTYNGGLMTVFFACGSNPLRIWDIYRKNGSISKFLDQDIKSSVLEISGVNVSTTYIVCPKGKTVLGINLPFLVMTVKNLKKYFSFEVTILDHTRVRRRFRVSNFQSTTQVNPLCTFMPIGLSEGWNQIQFNLAEFTRRAYKTQYLEVQKVKINCNIRLRRVYFAERLMTDEELPAEYKLFISVASKVGKPRRPTVTKEKLIIPEEKESPDERKNSNIGMALAASVHSYRMSQEKMAPFGHEGVESNLAEARVASRQFLDKQKQEACKLVTSNVLLEEGDAFVQLHAADTESVPDEAVIEVIEGDLPEGNAEEHIPADAVGDQPKDIEVTGEEIREGTTEEEIILEAVESQTNTDATEVQPVQFSTVATTVQEPDLHEEERLRIVSSQRSMSTIPEESDETPPAD